MRSKNTSISKARVAIDIGGTFTDLVAFVEYEDGQRETLTCKTDSTPEDFSRGFFNAIESVGLDFSKIECLVHGTTIGINTILQRKGAKVGFITTEGFKDIIHMGRGERPEFFNLNFQKPESFVERHLCFEIKERINANGKVVSPVKLDQIPQILNYFRQEGVEAIAICTLHSYANPTHERAIADEIKKLWPTIPVVASTDISKELREYERSNTAVMSAYIKPVIEQYLDQLLIKLKERQFKGNFYIMKSNAGIETVEGIKNCPIQIVESGPAAGFIAAGQFGKKVMGIDVGGTSFKVAVIVDGKPEIKSLYEIGRNETSPGYPLQMPVVDLSEIGNGGGSIAWVNDYGHLLVGPMSAGAQPGPAAYGKGGLAPTVTDACLVLGWINPEKFADGTKTADLEAAHRALNTLAAKLGYEQIDHNSSREIAKNIIMISQNNMLQALKSVSVSRGYDPREFALVPYGGGGGMHAGRLAQFLGMTKIVIPPHSEVFSADGMLGSDLRRDYSQTVIASLASENFADLLAESFHQLELKAKKSFAKELNNPEVNLSYFACLQYEGQGHSVEIPLGKNEFNRQAIEAIFSEQHRKAFTFSLDNSPIDLVKIRIEATVKILELNQQKLQAEESTSSNTNKKRMIDFVEDGYCEATVYDGSQFKPGMKFSGPAVIENQGGTFLVLPGMTGCVDEFGQINMDVAPLMKDQQVLRKNELITQEIIQHSIVSITQQMFSQVIRTAMSPIIYEVLDMSTGLTDAQGNLISSGAGMPGFTVLLDFPVKAVIKALGGTLKRGDIIAVNDPYHGGVTHRSDLVLVMPIFDDHDQLIAFSVVIAHQNDIGGIAHGSLSPEAKHIDDEGFFVPPTKLYSENIRNEEFFNKFVDASRMKDNLKGDIMAAVAAVRKGEQATLELVRKYSSPVFLEALDAYQKYGEEITRANLKKLPQGRFEFSELQDDKQTFNAVITISPEEMIIDLRDNPKQSTGPFNLSEDAAIVAARTILASVTSAAVCNEGAFRCLKVLTTKATIFNPNYPAPQGFYFETWVVLHSLLQQTLAKAAIKNIPAGGFSSICGTLFGGKHAETGKSWQVVEPQSGGHGGSDGLDGASATHSFFHGNTQNTSNEVLEARNNNILILRHSFNPEEGGEGKYCGGKGICKEILFLSDENWATAFYTRSDVKPWGLADGNPGSNNYIEIVHAENGQVEHRSTVTEIELKRGDILRIVTGNGGGWGKPCERPPEQIEKDRKQGLISEKQYWQFFKPAIVSINSSNALQKQVSLQ
ncbi:Acetophenone carboxylase gamma subunit [Legionella massiliensis]|uniref:Acetophenone carboxylase gamma subunit n=1 Tax=Legionella massiliensis TaxID=1034943 RepID=A0A078KV27_9GAMM|nr:hydantoinase B/oxoprolinase family protein [Legionella massiliensis]CDZ76847.1 Acetophenone carboxylase gamma subunit [Legionella massiliensis]CEE12585.1 Acetophenone carboxylase gamma subunit [Legionella massiliensis]